MTTITRERLEWLSNISGRDDIEDICGDEIRELARIVLASLEAEPVSFDDLRDAVAEVSGGPAMEWNDIYKGHQGVPFINFNSLARIVDKFRTAPPAPVSVPDALPENDDEEGNDIDYMEPSEIYALGRTAGWNACRAAMLQGAEQPQNEQQNIPENIPTLRDGLAAIRSLGEIDAGKIQAERDSLNSPVIPDGWVACSERMPSSQEWVIVYAKWANQQVLCWDDVANRWTDFEDQSYFHDMFSHWMPLPAAPQQEVK